MNSKEYNLALSVSHNSSAALMCNGEIIVAVCEERSARTKNYLGYPKKAVEYCLKKAGIKGSDLHRVAYTTIYTQGVLVKAKTNTEFSLQDYHDYYGEKYYQKRFRGEDYFDYLKWLRDDPKFNQSEEYYDFSYLTDDVLHDEQRDVDLFREEQATKLGSHLGIGVERIEFLDHHTCHAFYTYFGSPFRGDDCIILTLDGWGDGRNQTVWTVKDDKMSLLADSNQNDLGRIYKLATLLLGMRPDEHEFKVMGLAAYAKKSYVAKAKQVIEDICAVDGIRIVSRNRPKDLYSYLKKGWETHRFDNIAGAVQDYTEEIACELVRNIVKQTGIRKIVVGGGIAMNIKMNKVISELDEVDAMFVCGSSGDESLSIGGCYLMNSKQESNKPLPNLYLGFDIGDEIKSFDFSEYASEFIVRQDVDHAYVAGLLAQGDIVSVIRGKAEFGARALGNRSILADPRQRESVQKINEAIKNRDFWMPFALSILKEHSDDYILNPKRLESPFMAISLDVRPEKHQEIIAGTHPYDKTVRPQFIVKSEAPDYHHLVKEFMALTGIPALLNTSFNLHGEPIVDTISDAIRTFRLSGLDHLYINDRILVSKKSADRV